MNQKNKIWLSSPHMGGDEFRFVEEAFRSNWIAPVGPHVSGFEQEICSRTGATFAAALSSGTAAMHLALILLGVKRDDEVICSTFTFSATANPVIYQGAVPVFVDSSDGSWNMSPALLEEAINGRMEEGKKPKAIIVVHLYGNPAPMDMIMNIAQKYNIPVIEDAAEALGSVYKGAAPGIFGVMGVLSFNGNKIITTSGGGALISDNGELISRARFLATQARDEAPHYQHTQIGYNYRLSNICAAIGMGQMKVLSLRVKQRRQNYTYYRRALGDLPGIGFQEELQGAASNRWLTCITVDPETAGITSEKIRLELEKENIESRPLWKPMHLQPVYKGYPYYGNGVSDKLFKKGLCLPSGSNLDTGDLDRVIEVIVKCWGNGFKVKSKKSKVKS